MVVGQFEIGVHLARSMCDKVSMRATMPPMRDPNALSEGEKVILRHLRDTNAEPDLYEYPAELAQLIPDVDDRNQAQAGLAGRGLIKRMVYPSGVSEEISSCTPTRAGKKFIDAGGWDD